MKILSLLKKEEHLKVKTRIAPSPTGPLHIGTARTALFNYIFARQHKGKFVLRIEDTDTQRSDKRFEEDIVNGLKWLELNYDEFYRQSERKNIYKKYLKKLLEKNKAFWCYHTKETLAEEKKKQMQNRQAPRHLCDHKETRNKKQTNKQGVIRLKGSDKKIKFHDLIRGEIEYDASLLGDIAIAKNEEAPLYNFAVVVDDHEMEISHVIRGEDHIPNTPKQILIQEALDIKTPFYAHIPLILSPDKSKMSKRHGATSLSEYQRDGYLPGALTNFMALLGWNPGNDKEMIEKQELLKLFSLDKIQKGGAVFNIDKLNWFNKEYLKNMSAAELSKEILNYIPKEWQTKIEERPSYWKKILELEKSRLTKLSEIKEGIDYFFNKPSFSKSLLIWENETLDKTAQHLDKLTNLLSGLNSGSFALKKIKEAVWDYAEKEGRGSVLWPFRVSLTGQAKSPDPFIVAEILGKEETLARVQYAKDMIYGNN